MSLAPELLVDVEAVTSTYLSAQTEITTLLGDENRVYTAIPRNPTFPLVRLTRIGGSPVRSRPLHLDMATIQVEVYGGTKAQAWTLAETCRQHLANMEDATHDSGNAVVTGVQFGPLAYLPDTSFDAAKPRYSFDVDIFAHPVPNPGS